MRGPHSHRSLGKLRPAQAWKRRQVHLLALKSTMNGLFDMAVTFGSGPARPSGSEETA